MVGLGKPQLRAKFEVASPSRCRNIIGKPQNFGSSPSPEPPNFSAGCDFMMGLGKPELCTKFEVDSFSRCRNIKGEASTFEELP